MLQRDIHAISSLEEELTNLARQQAAVAQLGQRALLGIELPALMDETVAIVAQTLEVEYCKVLELLPGNQELLLVAGVGWKPKTVGRTKVGAGLDSQAGFTLTSNEPVIVEDLSSETRFRGPALLFDHQVVSGMSVIIQGEEQRYGVLSVHTTRRRLFTRDDVNFLQSVANLLSTAIQRKRAEEAIIALNATLKKLVEAGIGNVRLLQEVAVAANEARSIEEAMQFALDRICAHTGWPVGHVYLTIQQSGSPRQGRGANGSEVVLFPTRLWHLDNERFNPFRQVTRASPLAPGSGLPGRVYASGESAWISNVLEDPNFPPDLMGFGIKSGFAFPVMVGKEVAAVLEFFSEQAIQPDVQLLEVMGQIGAQLGLVVERVRTEEELRQRERQLSEVQQVSQIGSWTWDIVKNEVRWSDELSHIFGVEPRDSFGSYADYLERVHPEDSDLAKQVIEKASQDHQPFEFTHQVIHPDGSIRIIHGPGKVIVDEAGKLLQMLGTGQNITERVKLENALHESLAMLENIFEMAPDGAVLVDDKGHIVRLNRQVENLFCYSREELLGQPLEILLPEDSRERHVQLRREYQREPRLRPMSISMELKARRKDGSGFPVEVMLSPLQTTQGTLVIAMVRDISSRIQAAEKIQRSEQHFRSLIENAQDIITILEADGTIRYESPSIEHVVGYKPDELIGKNAFDFIHPDDLPKVIEIFAEGSSTPGYTNALTLRFCHKDGSWRVLEAIGKNLLNDPAVAGVVVNSRDITGQRRAEEALQQSEARFRTIFEGAATGIAVVDLEGRIQVSTSSLQSMLGYSAEELRGKDINQLTHPMDVDTAKDVYRRLFAGEGDYYQTEMRYVHVDGQVIWVHLIISLVRDTNKAPRFVIKMIEDITARKQMEAELAEVQHRLLPSPEQERIRLAQELHDDPMQDLYGILYQLNDFDEVLKDEKHVRQMRDVHQSLQQVINTLRSICGELRSPTLAPFGLEGAIREHAEQFQEKHPHIKVTLDLIYDGSMLSEDLRLNLFRIYQQAMNNVVRHANATRISVSLVWDEEKLYLEIEDNGRGFDVPARWIGLARQGHLGLVGATERAEIIGGQLKVVSNPGKGTRISVMVPKDQESVRSWSAIT